MTDEQWLWIFANQSLDADEKLENMCPDCRKEVAQHRCIRCGKIISGSTEFEESFVNENFDEARYEAMKNGTYKLPSKDESESLKASSNELVEPETDDGSNDIDIGLVQQIMS